MRRLIVGFALVVACLESAGAVPWVMHEVDARFRGANALSPGDVDGDGWIDYVTNYEFDQRVVVALHPGPADAARAWPTADAWSAPRSPSAGVNPEHAALADLDADGAVDILVAQGYSSMTSYEGSSPGIRVLWGRGREPLTEGWTDGGRVSATMDAGHFLYVQTADLDGDGRLDVVAGGRVHAGNGKKTGLVWLEVPADLPRDLARWVVHPIDPDQWSGHGFAFDDVDEDGDLDLALANADWDTPEAEEELVWYENPGSGAVAAAASWTKHVIYRGEEFFAKPQIAVADLDRDGRRDLATQVRDAIYWFRKTGTSPVTWERVVLMKDRATQWLGRAVRAADLNGDGRLDLAAALIHDAGLLPGDKAALFWMEAPADPVRDAWTTHVVKWGSGRTMLIPVFGEKWDQLHVIDIDGDGDLDIVANCEEWWEDGAVMAPFYDASALPAVVAVAWFENPLGEGPRIAIEREGICAFEAERPSDSLDGTWIARDGGATALGAGALVDPNVIDPNPREWEATRGVVYDLQLAGGSYDVWLRLSAPSTWGPFLGGERSDALWVSLRGGPVAVSGGRAAVETWTWVRAVSSQHLAAGEHQLTLRSREGGVSVDRIVVQRSGLAEPDGAGPATTPAPTAEVEGGSP
ncbi:MAG: FG-GAP-like repeat-containing protein [Candidatus Bipolaricaulota bacterium]